MAIWLTVTECGCTEVVDDNEATLRPVLVAEKSTNSNPVLLLSESDGQVVFIPERS